MGFRVSDENIDSHNDSSRAGKKDKRQRLKKEMVAYYALTAYVCHGGRKTRAIGFQENITAV